MMLPISITHGILHIISVLLADYAGNKNTVFPLQKTLRMSDKFINSHIDISLV